MWHLISFILKGQTKDVNSAINIMIKVNHPDEILKQQSSRGKLLYKRYKQLDLEYQKLLSSAEKNKDDEILLFKYPSSAMSFTTEVSNELMYKFPNKLIVIARQKGDEMKVSLRSTKIDLPRALGSALIGISGYGGGHPRASGACIKIDDFDKFILNMKELVKKSE
jgi:single-stranded DNA-specific DHH superfamily exonuclease